MAGDGVPRVTKLDVDNYLSWSTELEHVMRYKRCWSAVKPRAGNATTSAVTGTSAGAGDAAAEAAADAAAAARVPL